MNNILSVTILIVNYNTSDFIELSLYALKKLSKYNYKVHIADNGSDNHDYTHLIGVCEKFDNVFVEQLDHNFRGSLAHGTALNHLIKHVDTPYFSVLDADATWLIKNWDEILISKLNERVKVAGTQAGGYKPKDFPLMFCILFETKTFKKLQIDFRPTGPKQDTGWEIREKYIGKDFQGIVIKYFSTRSYKKGPFRNVISGEYYLEGYNQIFAAHFGRGASLGANKYLKGIKRYMYKIPLFGKKLLLKKGNIEKNKWLSISKSIIDEQASIL